MLVHRYQPPPARSQPRFSLRKQHWERSAEIWQKLRRGLAATLLPTRSEGQESADKQAEDMVEEMHIPDYVMLDFGSPGGGRYSLDTFYRSRGLLR